MIVTSNLVTMSTALRQLAVAILIVACGCCGNRAVDSGVRSDTLLSSTVSPPLRIVIGPFAAMEGDALDAVVSCDSDASPPIVDVYVATEQGVSRGGASGEKLQSLRLTLECRGYEQITQWERSEWGCYLRFIHKPTPVARAYRDGCFDVTASLWRAGIPFEIASSNDFEFWVPHAYAERARNAIHEVSSATAWVEVIPGSRSR